jgi:hypothetical protein
MEPAFLPVVPLPLSSARVRCVSSRVVMSHAQPRDISRRALVSTAISGTAMAVMSMLLPPLVRAAERATKQSDAAKPTKLRFVKDDSGISYADVKVRSSWSAVDLKRCPILLFFVFALEHNNLETHLTSVLVLLRRRFLPSLTLSL